ncbi:MAG: class II glutamine amidotransferase, partial [Candidatus Aenigmarchaeota archaeon]|nr:class II glutamine amidotransferase [Candidatus Aenigmarchaeota archaeon]
MCGIIGYIGKEKAAPILLNGLKRLEYRGYDSCGIATINSGLQIRKDIGRISEANSKHKFSELGGTIGMAHTRWATHGGVTQQNAHPHTDCKNEIAVAHNGIIENYQELREKLQKAGHSFKSQTDTEII